MARVTETLPQDVPVTPANCHVCICGYVVVHPNPNLVGTVSKSLANMPGMSHYLCPDCIAEVWRKSGRDPNTHKRTESETCTNGVRQ